MDVIGNNIANVNTYGFKKGRVNFQDMLSQTLSGAAKPREDKGGVNPKQVGLGMMVASIDTIHTQGALQVTGVNTDLAMMGEGFFILRQGDRVFHTRNGAFSIDKNGYYVNPANGLKVQGWMAQPDDEGVNVVQTAGSIEDIVLPLNDKDPARATQNIWYHCNLNKLDADGTHQTDIEVYDDTGVRRQLRVNFFRDDGATPPTELPVNQWRARISVVENGEVVPGARVGVIPGEADPALDTSDLILTFNDNGSLVAVGDGTGANSVGEGGAAGTDEEGFELTATVNYQYSGSGGPPAAPAADILSPNITLNLGQLGRFDGITQFASPTTTKAIRQDGYTMGELESFTIDDNGQITGVYTNGNSKTLAQVAISKFTNAGGLEKVGESLFVESNNSGRANIGPAGLQGRGKMKAGALEMSNVDLAEQFTDMIVTQRGFQASSRSITTSDQMLQELLQLKR